MAMQSRSSGERRSSYALRGSGVTGESESEECDGAKNWCKNKKHSGQKMVKVTYCLL